MEIKLKFAVILAIFVPFLFSCSQPEAAGQNIVANVNSGIETGKEHSVSNAVLNEIQEEKAEKPLTGTIKIQNPLPKQSGDWVTRWQWKRILKWGNQCNIDSQEANADVWKENSIEFYHLADKNLLIQVMCNGGMYNQSYYFYHYNIQENSTAELLNFETFQFNDSKSGKSKIIRNVTNNPYANPTFEENTQLLKMYFKSTGFSGYEHTYEFLQGKMTLLQRTVTECSAESDAPCQPIKQNLKKLRRVANTFYNYEP